MSRVFYPTQHLTLQLIFPPKSKMAGVVGKGFVKEGLASPSRGSSPNPGPRMLGMCTVQLLSQWPVVLGGTPISPSGSQQRSQGVPHLVTGLQASHEPQWGHCPPHTEEAAADTNKTLCHSPFFLGIYELPDTSLPALHMTLNQLQATFLPPGGVPREMPGHNIASRVSSPLPPPSSAPEPSWQSPGYQDTQAGLS